MSVAGCTRGLEVSCRPTGPFLPRHVLPPHLMIKPSALLWKPATPHPLFPSSLGDSSKGSRWGPGVSPVWGQWVVLSLVIAEAVVYVVHLV